MTNNIEHIGALNGILESFGIENRDVILVGSAAMAAKGIRQNRDLDIALNPEARKTLLKKHEARLEILDSGTICFPLQIQSAADRYKSLYIFDKDLFEKNDRLTNCNIGFQVVRLELEAAHKALRRRPKDLADVDLIMDYALQADDWDWALFRKLLNNAQTSPSRTRGAKSFLSSLLPQRIRSLLGFTKRAAQRIRQDPRLLKKIPGRIASVVQRKMTISTKPKLASEVSATTVSLMPTAALLHFQRIGGEFSRYDVLARYLALEEIEKGERGEALDLYVKMQSKRVHRETEQEFRRLADSIRKSGFSWRYPIPVTGNGMLLDGSHRLACALYHNVSYVPVTFVSGPKEVRYGRQWFEEQGFSDETLSRLDALRHRLFLEWGLYFSLILWPPVASMFDEIEDWLSERYRIVWSEDLELGSRFENFARSIYEIDDIERWKVETKISAMREYPENVRALFLELPLPGFRVKSRTCAYLSDAGAKLKKDVRDRYSPRVPDYFYDIVAHTGDNHEHNIQTLAILRAHGAAPEVSSVRYAGTGQKRLP